MAFRAKFASTCTLCQGKIYPGDYKTWNRVTRGDMHLECWRKTPQYATWKAKQSNEQAFIPNTVGTTEATPPKETTTTDLPFELGDNLPITTKEQLPVMELQEQHVAHDSDNKALDVLGQAIWARIEPKVSQLENLREEFAKFEIEFRREQAEELAEIRAELPKPTVVHIKDNTTGEIKDCGIQHRTFPDVVKILSARDHEGHRLNLWMVGPAGTGKSRATQEAAKALNMRYASTGSIIESYKVLGHFSPGTGEYKTTQFRDFWEHGGLYCFDDFDGSDPNCVVELLAISNGLFAFPDKMVPRHPDFCLVLTANTWGLGGTSDYVGRMKQDAAFINRFVSLHWDIDEDLENVTCPNIQWSKRVQEIRAKVKAKGIKVMITPRQSYQGAALLASGFTQVQVEEILLKQSMTSDQWQSIL